MDKSDKALDQRISWWREVDKPAIEAVANACNTTPEYIRMLVYGHRRPQTDLAKLLAEHTGLPREAWRPDVWGS